MKSKIKKPFLELNKLKSIQELEQDRRDKEDRFKEIAYSQPHPSQNRKASTPQEPHMGRFYPPNKVLSQGMTPLSKQRGILSPPSQGIYTPQI